MVVADDQRDAMQTAFEQTLEQVARHVENRADRSIDLVGHARDQDTQRRLMGDFYARAAENYQDPVAVAPVVAGAYSGHPVPQHGTPPFTLPPITIMTLAAP